MRWDQICLRVMLVSLGVTAAAGVTLIFAAESEMLVRLLGTAGAAAGASALMWPLTKLADWESTRLSGLVGMGTVLVEFGLLVLIIWGEPVYRALEVPIGDMLIWLFVFILLVAPGALFFLALWNRPGAWVGARVGAGAAALVLMELITAILHPGGRYFLPQEQWTLAATMTAIFGVLAACCLFGDVSERPWRWLGVAAATLGWMMGTVHAFRHTGSDLGQTIFTLLTTTAILVAHANLCMLPPLSAGQAIFRIATIVLALITGVLVDCLILIEIFFLDNPPGELVARSTAATGILTGCGTIAILVFALINRSQTPRDTVALSFLEMSITCPACAEPQKVNLGDSTCVNCGLLIRIQVRRPSA